MFSFSLKKIFFEKLLRKPLWYARRLQQYNEQTVSSIFVRFFEPFLTLVSAFFFLSIF